MHAQGRNDPYTGIPVDLFLRGNGSTSGPDTALEHVGRARPMLKVDGQETMVENELGLALVIVKSDTIGCRGRHCLGASGSGR